MTAETPLELTAPIPEVHLPRYEEIPNVGLYLEQTAKYINEYLQPLEGVGITTSMISNYVKKKLVANPVKKQYDREQIAYLIAIAVLKTVLSLDNIGALLAMQKERYSTAQAYQYFCTELESVIRNVFTQRDGLPAPESEAEPCKRLLRTAIITVAHKIYLDQCFQLLQPPVNEE